MGKIQQGMSLSLMFITGIASLATALTMAGSAEAGVINSCVTYCHSLPPTDGSRKGSTVATPTNATFQGSHQSHATALVSSCVKCHPGAAGYSFDHMTSAAKPVIKLAPNINGSPVSASYTRTGGGTAFLNQTTLPPLGSCNSVNCHFEQTTPAWGGTAFSSPANCASCHGAPPTGTATGSAGSHVRHDAYFTGTTQCNKCHPNHLLEAAPFAHATSAAHTVVRVTLADPAGVAGGAYSGSGANFLPSQSGVQTFGTCSTNYCHSSAQGPTGSGAVTYASVLWGSGALNCGSCHQNMSASASAPGSHTPHTQASGTVFTCDVCHGTGYGVAAVSIPTHVNKQINLSFTANATGTAYSKGSAFVPGSAYGSCNTRNCHGGGAPVWGVNTTLNHCFKCHGTKVAPFTNVSAATVAPGYGTNDGRDTAGNTAATAPRVGAHQTHLTGTDNISAPIHCGECHAMHPTVQNGTHLQFTSARITFGPLARTAAHTPTATRVAGAVNCSNTYCHTGNRTGATATSTTPVFNANLIGNTSIADTCTNKCHQMPPGGGVAGDTHAGLTANGTYTTPASLSACSSNTPATGCHPSINAAPTSMATIFFNKLLHINGSVDGGGTCVGCHNKVITRTKGRPGTTLANVAGEFGLAWGHKKAGRTAVVDADCIVCHLEGDSTTGKPNATYHQNGNIDLRDPKGATSESPITNISGGAFTFQRFSTSYAAGSRTTTGHLSNTDIANVITQKFCLGCHSATGATNAGARSGTAPTQYLPFGTGSRNGATYTVGLSAGVVGGVVDVDSQLATTNSSFHPVKGPQNNSYAQGTRMVAPYGVTKTNGVPSIGVVMNCFDCHNKAGAPLTLRTVAAHGNAVTLRGTATVTGTPSASNGVTLCSVCHAGYFGGTANRHGTGSAFNSSTDSGMTSYVNYGCNICHASGYTTAVVRPVRGQDVHGVNALPTGGITKTLRWAGTAQGTPALVDARPIAFIRNTQALPNHTPKQNGTTVYTPNCMGGNVSPCSQGSKSYAPGGIY